MIRLPRITTSPQFAKLTALARVLAMVLPSITASSACCRMIPPENTALCAVAVPVFGPISTTPDRLAPSMMLPCTRSRLSSRVEAEARTPRYIPFAPTGLMMFPEIRTSVIIVPVMPLSEPKRSPEGTLAALGAYGRRILLATKKLVLTCPFANCVNAMQSSVDSISQPVIETLRLLPT